MLYDYADFSELMDEVDLFNPRNKYILISPDKFDSRVSFEQKKLLKRVPWSIIVDFDLDSKGKMDYSRRLMLRMTIDMYHLQSLSLRMESCQYLPVPSV